MREKAETPFRLFLKDNNIKQVEVARYLGVHPTVVSEYAYGGKISDEQMQKLLKHPKWITYHLCTTNEPAPPTYIDPVELLQIVKEQYEQMNIIVKTQAATISTLQAMLNNMLIKKND